MCIRDRNLAVVKGGCGISIPGVEPTTRVNFDQALLYCKKKGPGWHLTSNAEWAALAMWCAKNGWLYNCPLYTSPSPRDRTRPRMPSSP